MSRPVGLPSSPRPPGKNRPASSANQNSIHLLTAGPSGKRIDYQRHRSISESRRSTVPLHGKHSAHPTTSERPRISSPLIQRQVSRNSPYVERRKTDQPRVNTSHSHSSELPTYYWNRAGEVTSAAIAQWRAGIPALGSLVDDSEEDDDHLLKVMRSYHLKKARTRKELPAWLFDEKERGTVMPLRGRTLPERFEVIEAAGSPPPLPPKDNLYSDSSSGRLKKLWNRRWKSSAKRKSVESLY